MTDYIIPLKPVEHQQITVNLGDKNYKIDVRQLGGRLYFSLYDSLGASIKQGVLCLNNVTIQPEIYLGFVGSFKFTDYQGSTDPSYDGLGGRYQLVYTV